MTDIINAAPGSKNMKILGIITIILGLLAIAAPLITGIAIAILVGILVLCGGIARIVWAFHAASFSKGLLGFVVGGLTLLCGIALVTDPVFASGVLTIILAVYFLIDGAFEIARAFQIRPAPGWNWLLLGGLISFLLGLMIWQQFPLSGAWAIGLLLGIKLLFIGIIMISFRPIPQSNA